jgi:hypothetical protein
MRQFHSCVTSGCRPFNNEQCSVDIVERTTGSGRDMTALYQLDFQPLIYVNVGADMQVVLVLTALLVASEGLWTLSRSSLCMPNVWSCSVSNVLSVLFGQGIHDRAILQ